MEHDIFISYCRKDSPIADKICAALEEQGITYFIDRQGIAGGKEFPEVLADAIIGCRIMLYLASANSYGSKYTNNEITFAFNEKPKGSIIPYVLDGSCLPATQRFIFASVNIRTLKDHPIETVLMHDLCELLGKEYIEPESVRQERLRKEELDRKRQEEESIRQEEIRRKKEEKERKRREEEKKKQELEKIQQANQSVRKVNEEKTKKQSTSKKESSFIEKAKENVFPIIIIVIVLLMTIGLRSMCSGSGGKDVSSKIETGMDTLSYALGMAQTEGLTKYLSETLKVDTTLMKDFVSGLYDLDIPSDPERRKAYQSGNTLKLQIENSMIPNINHELFGDDATNTISHKLFMNGFADGALRNYHIMPAEVAHNTANHLMQTIRQDRMNQEYGYNKKDGEDFLKKNAMEKGVVTLPGGTQYKIIKAGQGAIPKVTSNITVNYEGRTIDGTVFDSTYKNNKPLTLQLNKAIQGWQDALTHMREGSIWEIYIPQDRAYGERMQNSIKPFSVLIFKIELLKVEKE